MTTQTYHLIPEPAGDYRENEIPVDVYGTRYRLRPIKARAGQLWRVEWGDDIYKVTDGIEVIGMGLSSIKANRLCDLLNRPVSAQACASEAQEHPLKEWAQEHAIKALNSTVAALRLELEAMTSRAVEMQTERTKLFMELEEAKRKLDASGREWLALTKDKAALEGCIESLRAQLKSQLEDARLFGEIMAAMNGDGGHYQAAHGSQKAYENALELWYARYRQIDAAEADRDQIKSQSSGKTAEKHSYCAKHDTYPANDEPCWQCLNPLLFEVEADRDQWRDKAKHWEAIKRVEWSVPSESPNADETEFEAFAIKEFGEHYCRCAPCRELIKSALAHAIATEGK